jgi:hypothetical protein
MIFDQTRNKKIHVFPHFWKHYFSYHKLEQKDSNYRFLTDVYLIFFTIIYIATVID